jgi:hypothetical protein
MTEKRKRLAAVVVVIEVYNPLAAKGWKRKKMKKRWLPCSFFYFPSSVRLFFFFLENKLFFLVGQHESLLGGRAISDEGKKNDDDVIDNRYQSLPPQD